MRKYKFRLMLDVDQCLAFYQGLYTDVVVQAENGQTVQLPLRYFRPYISHAGVNARFVLTLTEQGKFSSLEKIN
ncbi:MAG: DUF2835 domain-containing protein [Gammaproteobacteria bacterium]|nr:DUF2835 domain-containing protein [Gammaproteobacteria bacterium]MBU2057922.1 DUF2835 domain-containing protein [Gammaproteobacteria bacterium]MBU2174274.1 DUF2835 domain-containing protein [Gammaproteobacteria bacterium]MBU2247776.1 DUF2835 domain-containing protein [Gammaproteobacteria bacterium]MBU2344301.1 DUF2835 domain-containing protein [Gammaproteobacteria bacterium]